MIESIFVFESTRSRQRNAPLLKERERYLSHLTGTSAVQKSKPICDAQGAISPHPPRVYIYGCRREVEASRC